MSFEKCKNIASQKFAVLLVLVLLVVTQLVLVGQTELFLSVSPGTKSQTSLQSTTSRLGLAPFQQNLETVVPSRRLFLAIFTSRKLDARLRNAIRKSYLSFHDKFSNYFPTISVCSYQEYQQMSSDQRLSQCQVVYTFVLDGNIKSTTADEPDILYLNIAQYKTQQPRNRVLSLLMLLWDRTNNAGFDFEYIAYTHSAVVLYPTKLWPWQLFQDGKDDMVLGYSPGENGTQHENTKAGRDFMLMSSSLLPEFLGRSSAPISLPNEDTEDVIFDTINKLRTKGWQNISMEPYHDAMTVIQREYYLEFVNAWDAYKDALITYENIEEEQQVRANPLVNSSVSLYESGPRVILGIFTMDSEKEMKRRQAIRESYLRAFDSTSTPNRVCSLLDLMARKNPELSLECQLAYTFVLGGNPNGPTEFVNPSNVTPMTVAGPTSLSKERDLVFLNIQENLKSGKSQSFVKYATLVIDQHFYFDYIAKTDSDTLLFPDRFLDDVVNNLPRFPRNVRVYGGSPAVKAEYDHLRGLTYNQGSLYWMSVDLSRYITSDQCDRESLKVFSEDKSIGNFIHSHELPIHRIHVSASHPVFVHPIKSVMDYRHRWQKYQGGLS